MTKFSRSVSLIQIYLGCQTAEIRPTKGQGNACVVVSPVGYLQVFSISPPEEKIMFTLLLDDLSPAAKSLQIIGFSVLGLLVLSVILAAVLNNKVPFDTRSIVYGGICAALSFVLSFIKIPIGTYGGSITIASMLPIFIFAYVFGIGKGLIVGVVYGLLQFIQEPFFLSFAQVALDYILAYATICLAGVFKKMKSKTASVFLGLGLVCAVRFTFHTISGIIFFNSGYIATLPFFGASQNFSAFIYSLLYNSIYMIPETAILFVVVGSMLVSKTFWLLCNYIRKEKPKKIETN